MKLLVSLGSIIGVIVIACYTFIVKINILTKGHTIEKYKRIYYVLITFELLLISMIFLPFHAKGDDYLMEGMSTGSRVIITPEKFKVKFKEAKRSFSNRIFIEEKELEEISVKCTAKTGKVFLRIVQDKMDKTVEITNKEEALELSEYKPGYISFTLKNENALDVTFELYWQMD